MLELRPPGSARLFEHLSSVGRCGAREGRDKLFVSGRVWRVHGKAVAGESLKAKAL